MDWHRLGDKPLSDTMMVSLLTYVSHLNELMYIMLQKSIY